LDKSQNSFDVAIADGIMNPDPLSEAQSVQNLKTAPSAGPWMSMSQVEAAEVIHMHMRHEHVPDPQKLAWCQS